MKDVTGIGNIVWDIGIIFSNKNDIGREKGVAHAVSYDGIKETLESMLNLNFSDLDNLEPYKKYRFKGFDFMLNPGGVEANLISNCSKLGLKTAFIGKCGCDIFGLRYFCDLQNCDVEPCLIPDKKLNTGLVVCLVTFDKERTFLVYQGANEKLYPREINRDLIKDSRFLNLSAFTLESSPGVIDEAFKIAGEYGTKISFDLADKNIVKRKKEKLEDLLLNEVFVLFANEMEGETFTGKTNYYEILNEMLIYSKIAVLKLGKKGALASDGINVHYEPGVSSNVVDTTGAGDALGAGFLYGLIKTNNIKTATKYGMKVAIEVIKEEGARSLKKGLK